MDVIIAMGGQKGGTGKSTTAVNLAVELGRRNHKVVLVDAGPQGTTTTWRDAAIEAGHPVPELVRVLEADKLVEQLPDLADRYDYVLVDLPSELGGLQRAALVVADVVVMPCGASAAEMWALTESTDLLNEARKRNPELRAFILQTRVQRGTTAGKCLREDLKAWGVHVLYQQLINRVAYREAMALGLGVTSMKGAAEATREFMDLVQELLGHLEGNGDEADPQDQSS